MPRQTRPNTAVVELKFKVAKGCTAAQARKVVWNHLSPSYDRIVLEPLEEERVGTDTLKMLLGAARIRRPAAE